MHNSELFLIAMAIIFTAPYLVWRLARIDFYAPLVVVQIIAGIILGPGVLGAIFPHYYATVFNPPVIGLLNGIAWWAVMVFVLVAGLELDLGQVWKNRYESGVTAGLALGTPLLLGAAVAAIARLMPGWIGPAAEPWQFILGVGMACAVTALPILVLLMEKLGILHEPIGQRILRYASLDDIAIWGVLATILMDWERVGRQIAFIAGIVVVAWLFRRLMRRISPSDRWYAALIWLAICGFSADWCGLHFMVGAFLAGASLDREWFDRAQIDALRHNVLLVMMPVFFLSTGLRTTWAMGGLKVCVFAAVLLAASVGGKLLGMHMAGRVLGWKPVERGLIGWLLQTKALIMIIFVNVLLDSRIITSETFTALLLMAVASTMLTVPMASPRLLQMRSARLMAGRI